MPRYPLAAQAGIISLGSINIDLVLRVSGAPIGTIIADDVSVGPGGKAANAAVVARHLGAATAVFGWIGDDEPGQVAVAGPRSAGVDVTGVATIAGPTGAAVVLVEPDGSKTIIRTPGANDAPGVPSTAIVAAICAAAHGSVLLVDVEIPPRIVDDCLAAAARHGVRVVLDPAPPEAVTAEMIASADVITPDHTEANVLTGVPADTNDGALHAATLLQAKGARVVMVKLAQGGCALVWEGGRGVVEPPPVGVVDTNGAGDAFAGAVAWAVLNDLGPVDAARMAAAASALATTERGGQLAQLDREHLEELQHRSHYRSA